MEKAGFVIILIILVSGCISVTDEQPRNIGQPTYTSKSYIENSSLWGSVANESLSAGDQFSNSSELHWKHMPITFSITSSCGNYQSKRIIWGFNVLTNETNNSVRFKKVDDSADISVKCFKEVPSEIPNTFTQGKAQYLNNGNEIESAVINYYNVNPNLDYYPGGCIIYPDTEVHELLHTFGFEHIENPRSIMSPEGTNCYVRKIDNEIIGKLKKIYG